MTDKIEQEAESLIDLLTEQCSDLENLLSLARQETAAAKKGNFAKIIDIYEERSELGERLETFQKQITDLRATLGHKVPANVADRISAVVNQTLAQDNETRKLLTASKEETSHELSKLEKTRHNTMLYSTTKKKGLALELDI